MDKSLKKLILNTDYLGIEPKLSFKGESRHKTIFGSSLTLFLAFLFVSGFVYFGKELIEKSDPTVIFSSSTNTESIDFQLNSKNFPFFIAIQNKADHQNFFKNESIFKINASLTKQYRVPVENGNFELNKTRIPVKMIDCDLLTNFPGLESEFKNMNVKYTYCIDPSENITIKGDFSNDEFYLFQFDMTACYNETSQDSCLDKEQIDNSLRNTYLSINYGQHNIQPKNYTHSMINKKTDFFTTISNQGYKQINIYLKRIYFQTDNGILFEDNDVKIYNQVERILELASNVVPSKSERMLSVNIRMSTTEDFYYRKYIKIQNVIAEVGGMLKFFFIFFEIAISLFTSNYYYLQLINENFCVNEESKQEMNQELSKIASNRILKEKETSQISKSIDEFKPEHKKSKRTLCGQKIEVPYKDYIFTFFKTKSHRRIYDLYLNGERLIKKLINIDYLISKQLEYEDLKKLILDHNQLILFQGSPCHNIEDENENIIYEKNYKIDELYNYLTKLDGESNKINEKIMNLYENVSFNQQNLLDKQ